MTRLAAFLTDQGCTVSEFQEENSYSFLEMQRSKVTKTITKKAA
jgi:hypothetical protein